MAENNRERESAWNLGTSIGKVNRISLTKNLEERFQTGQDNYSQFLKDAHKQNKEAGTKGYSTDFFDLNKDYKQFDFLRERSTGGPIVENGNNPSFKVEGSKLTLNDQVPVVKYIDSFEK